MKSCCRLSHNIFDFLGYGESPAQIEKKARDARITAFALVMITFVLMITMLVLLRVSLLPSEVMMGFGMIPYFGGVFLGAIGCGVFTGAIVFLAVASVCTARATGLNSFGLSSH